MQDPTENMNPEQAQRHWLSARDPWMYRKTRQKRPRGVPSLSAADVKVDQFGNVDWVRSVVELPCFGLPAPYLRFSGRKLIDKRRGIRFAFRCDRCPASAACGFIVEERISKSEGLKKARAAYRAAIVVSTDKEFAAFREGGPLITQLLKYNLINVNTCLRKEAAERRDREDRAKDAVRKRRARNQALRAGRPDPSHIEAANREREKRARALADYVTSADAAANIRKMGIIGATRDANVWFCWLLLGWQNQPRGASQIARELIARGLDGKSHNSLRGIVVTNLDRMKRWEVDILAGRTEPLWKRFDPEHTAPSPLSGTPTSPLTNLDGAHLTKLLDELARG